MLTQEALNKPKSKCVHVPIQNPIINAMQFLCSTTYAIFMTGTLLYSVDEPSVLVSSSAAEAAVFKQANINLSPEQKELLLWHYRLGHINIKYVQSLLQKPDQENHVSLSQVTISAHTVTNPCVQFANMLNRNDVNHLKIR